MTIVGIEYRARAYTKEDIIWHCVADHRKLARKSPEERNITCAHLTTLELLEVVRSRRARALPLKFVLLSFPPAPAVPL